MEALWIREISDIIIYFERSEAEQAKHNGKRKYESNFLDYSTRKKIDKRIILSRENVSEIEVFPSGGNGSDIEVIVPYGSFERLLNKGEIGDRWGGGQKISIKLKQET